MVHFRNVKYFLFPLNILRITKTWHTIRKGYSIEFFRELSNNFVMRNKKNETVTLKKSGNDVQLDYADLRKAVLVLRAVNHKLRQRIIDLLEDGETMTVTDIYIKLRLEQSVASQHLAILRRAGVVATERQGKFIYYSLDKNRLAQISVLVEDLAG
jgi:DNA-binding transcriptional ArsR family regulator